jgi:holo-[acyl-carrier protein] synthase
LHERIVGFGLEGVESTRFRRAERRFGERLHRRLFTESERTYAARRARGVESLSARFAAKSAARCALGVQGAAWRDFEVVREPGHPPGMRLHGRAAEAAQRLGVSRIALTLSHTASLSLACVILEGAS